MHRSPTLALVVISLGALCQAASDLQNGRCDRDFCACQIVRPVTDEVAEALANRSDDLEAPECPDWMATAHSGGIYDTSSAGSCSNIRQGSVGIVACYGYRSGFFENMPYFRPEFESVAGPNATSTCFISSWTVTDGEFGSVIVNYTEDDLPPECPSDAPPDDVMPTQSPSVSAIDEPVPSNSLRGESSGSSLPVSITLRQASLWVLWLWN